jgi:hypothetical protein
MRPSIDYLNARAASKPASGGRDYTPKRNPVDDQAQWTELTPREQSLLTISAHLADLASWFRNRAIDDIPF